tara:strand:+ start:2427 stop:2669 length:243 start_codon:yes stop_codon:yes gene_type:complete
MKVFIIAIVMWWGNINEIPPTDSIEVLTFNGQPLEFKTREQCFKHVSENLEDLKEFAKANYPTANAVKTIYCVERIRTGI